MTAEGRLGPRKPDFSVQVPSVNKTPEQMEAIQGNPEIFMQYLGDERFEDGPIWMLNLLTYEPNGGQRLYQEYGARAQAHISGMKDEKSGKSGGMQSFADQVYSLSGPAYDNFAIMEYPSRLAFIGYASGEGRK